MVITSNLYPPLVSDTLPSFIRTKTCRIRCDTRKKRKRVKSGIK